MDFAVIRAPANSPSFFTFLIDDLVVVESDKMELQGKIKHLTRRFLLLSG